MVNKAEYMKALLDNYEKMILSADNSKRIEELSKILVLRVNGRSYLSYDLETIADKYIKNHNLRIGYYKIDFDNKYIIFHSSASITDRFSKDKSYIIKGRERIDYLPFTHFGKYKIDFFYGMEPVVYGKNEMFYMEDLEYFSRLYLLKNRLGELINFEIDSKCLLHIKYKTSEEIKNGVFDLNFVNQELTAWVNNKKGIKKVMR